MNQFPKIHVLGQKKWCESDVPTLVDLQRRHLFFDPPAIVVRHKDGMQKKLKLGGT